MPVDYAPDFYFLSHQESTADMIEWIEGMMKDVDLTNHDGLAVKNLSRACYLAIQRAKEWQAENERQWFSQDTPWTADFLNKIMSVGLHLNDDKICRAVLGVAEIGLPQPETIKFIEKFGFKEMQDE
jgi:hypothetical protein